MTNDSRHGIQYPTAHTEAFLFLFFSFLFLLFDPSSQSEWVCGLSAVRKSIAGGHSVEQPNIQD